MPVFLQSNPTTHPVTNWMAVISSLTAKMSNQITLGFPEDAETISESIFDVFRMIYMVRTLEISTQITSAQATAVVTAFNAAYGTAAADLVGVLGVVYTSQIAKAQVAGDLKSANLDFIAQLCA